MRIFCHFYQIPFLDANIPKTARNAAKIYYRLKQDRLQIDKKFQGTQLENFFSSVPHEEISDTFNPFRMKEKYMKFFRVGSMKPILSTDRMLKN